MITDAPLGSTGRLNFVTIAGQSWGVGAISSVGQTALTTSPASRALQFATAQRDASFGITGVEDLRQLAPLRELTYTQNGGTFAETPASGFAAQVLSRAGVPYRLLIGNWARGSAAYSVLAKGTSTYARGIAMARRARQGFSNFACTGTLCFHGGSDALSATYQTEIRQWQVDWETDVNALAGTSGTIPWFVSQPPAPNNGSGALLGVIGIIEEFKTNPTKTVLVCPTYFLPLGDDYIHYASASSRLLGEYYGNAYYQHVIQGVQWNPLRPTTITRTANVVTLTFANAVGNLVLDTVAVTNPGNFGFEWNDDSARTITGVRLLDGNKVEVTLSGTPTINANTKIRYAYTSAAGPGRSGPRDGVRGNLRDSNTAVGALSGTPLHNWCCHFNESVT